jgi:type IV pilus assembly protein PilA
MNKNVKRVVRNKKGFTLVELMVVVAIIGVLTAIAIPVYNNVTDNAKAKADAATLKTIQTAVTMYMAANEGKWTSAAVGTDFYCLVSTYLAEVPEAQVEGASFSVNVNGIAEYSSGS